MNKLLTIFASFALVALLGSVAINKAEARTTACGSYDAAYGYYGQCDANNNPIAGTNPSTSSGQANTNTNTGSTALTTSNTGYNLSNNAYFNGVDPYATYNSAGQQITTSDMPTVGCNQYDTRQGGYVLCDLTGNSTGYWITSQNSGSTGNTTVNVNYNNSSNNYNNTSGYSNSNGCGYYGEGCNYNSGYGNYNYGYSNPSFGQQLAGVLVSSLFNNSYGYNYGYNSYDYINSGYYGGNSGYYGSSYPTTYTNTYTTPSYYTDESYYTYDTVYRPVSYFDESLDVFSGGSSGGSYFDDSVDIF